MFFRLAQRLPAYRGVMRAIVMHATQSNQKTRSYDERSAMAHKARAADQAPAATGASLASLNAQLGSQWFSHRSVKPDG